MKNYLKEFIFAALASILISISCVVFLSTQNKVVGSIIFSVGLLTILSFKLNLFTGKAPYICKNKLSYCLFVFIVWLGNFAGAWFTATLIKNTNIYSKIIDQCLIIATAKSTDSLISLAILGIFCGILMYIAVEAFNNYLCTNNVYLPILTIFCVSTFIIAGFEHSIADMFYFILALPIGKWFVPLIVISIGNALGGNLFCFICKNRL